MKLNIFHLRHFSPLACASVYLLENCLFILSAHFYKVFFENCLSLYELFSQSQHSYEYRMRVALQQMSFKYLSSGQPFGMIPVLILLFFLQDLFAFCGLSSRKRVLDAYHLQVQMPKQVPVSLLVRKGLQSHTQGRAFLRGLL